MTRLEFNEILKAININNHILNARGANGLEQEVYFWNDLLIQFSGTDYALIKGNIPLEFANILYNKYPKSHYKMRINGGTDIPNEDKHISMYYINAKEELIIFLTELNDYYARKKGLPETEVQRYDEIMATITGSILKKVNPCITATEWMAEDKEYGESYLSLIESEQKTLLGRVLRKMLEQFDKTINPFINEEIELDFAENYLKKVNINASTFGEVKHKKRDGCCKITISKKNSENEVAYFRNPNGFIYRLWYALGEGEYVIVSHYFRDDAEHELYNGEIINIEYFGNESNQMFNLIYNISKGLASSNSEPFTQVTAEQMSAVFDTLSKATRMASTITIDNMTKKTNIKKSDSQINI